MSSQRTSIAVVQTALGSDRESNIARVEELIFEASAKDAGIVVLPELFESPYFCREENEENFSLAGELDGHATISRFSQLARELEMVIPVPFFEKEGQSYYNSVAVIDADGSVLGRYRKSHIPDGPGYEEKFYFRPGTTGFRVWPTRYGRIGIGVCWDQWFPEAARSMVLDGADLLIYPSAIGTEPRHPDIDTRGPWRRVMVGHAVANAVPVAAANRIGKEGDQVFYGSSFIADHYGEVVADLGCDAEGVATADFDLDEVHRYRDWLGLFRDRRPELYTRLVDPDGRADSGRE